jgi:sulfite exporter TauE/SafE
MIGMGTMRLVASVTMQNEAVSHSTWTQVWTKQVISMRKHYAGWNLPTAAFSWGLTSTLLPCGWLYFFVLAAAAAPTSAMTIAIMFAFWLGTLPLLSVAAWSWTSMSPRLKALSQPVAAICIIGFGAYTLMGRSNIDLSSMARPVTSSTTASMMTFELIRKSLQAELPCCIGKNEQESGSIAAKQLSPKGLRDYEEISHARNP